MMSGAYDYDWEAYRKFVAKQLMKPTLGQTPVPSPAQIERGKQRVLHKLRVFKGGPNYVIEDNED